MTDLNYWVWLYSYHFVIVPDPNFALLSIQTISRHLWLKEKKTTLKFNFNLLCVCSHQFPEMFATVWTGEWCQNMRNFIGKNKIKQSRK